MLAKGGAVIVAAFICPSSVRLFSTSTNGRLCRCSASVLPVVMASIVAF